MRKLHLSALIAACLIGLLFGLRAMFPRSGAYSGTIMPYCGSFDGPASLMWLRADSGHYQNIHVFIDGLTLQPSKNGTSPYALKAGTKVTSDPPKTQSTEPESALLISVCRDQDFTRHCLDTESAIISINNIDQNFVSGDLSFRVLYIFERHIKFKAKLLPWPKNLVCG